MSDVLPQSRFVVVFAQAVANGLVFLAFRIANEEPELRKAVWETSETSS